MLLNRLLQSETWLSQRLRGLLGQVEPVMPPPVSPGPRTMRLAYLSYARDQLQNQNHRKTRSLPPLLPVPLADGVDLFVPTALAGSSQPLDLILHLRGGTPQAFAQLQQPALIVRADCAGLAGALLKRFGSKHWVQQTREAVMQACWQEWRWLPLIERQVLSSFGAGYAPLARALQQDTVIHQTDALFILDGIHYGQPGKVDRHALEPFTHFARLAASGRKLMVLTHSSIVPDYASAADTAQYLLRSVKAKKVRLAAELADDWTPSYRADKGGFHVEGYPGAEAASHIAQVQQIGRLWGSYLDLAPQSAGQARV